MTDEFTLRRSADKARRARELLENDILKEAFEILEKAYIETWRGTHVDAEHAREKLFLAVNIIGKVRHHLELVIANGSIAEADLKKIQQDFERKKLLGII